MAKRYANLKHIGYIREQDCMICKTDYFVEAHHLLKPWRGARGMSLKAAFPCVLSVTESYTRKGASLNFSKQRVAAKITASSGQGYSG
jgi:hypothetical protein